MSEFRMPSLGADMDRGTVLEWLVGPGDQVRRGQAVAVVDTEKAAIEVESFADGVLSDIVVPPGREVPVGTVLAHIGPPAPAAPAPAAEVPPPPPPVGSPLVRRRARARPVEPPPVPAGRGGRVRSSPYARRRARELRVDLDRVAGTGPSGAVLAADVDRGRPAAPAPPAPPAVPAPPAADRGTRRRSAVAELMARSKREIPHFYLTTTVDMAAATAWLRQANSDRPLARRLLPAALLLRATVLAARRQPHLNGHWGDDGFHPSDAVHLGVAVALRDGSLVAPAIRDADGLDLDELMGRLRDLVRRARSGRLRREELTDPTITVTSLGDLGVDSVLPVIYPPQVAMVGFGEISERPWAVDGLLGVRPVVTATLAADHRASDGHRGGLFLSAVATALQTPEQL